METIDKQWEQKTSYGASAKKSKLSKLKTRSMVDKEDNINNYSASPTLLSGEGIYLSTMETIRFNNENNESQQWKQWEKQWEQKTSYGASAKKSKLSKPKETMKTMMETMMKTMRFNNR